MDNVLILGNGAAGISAAETIRSIDTEIKITMAAQLDLPAYSPCALPDWLAGSIEKHQLFIKDEDSYSRLGIETCFGHCIDHIDPVHHLVTTKYDRIHYEHLIIALGSRAIIPAVPGSSLPGNFTFKNIRDVEAILANRPSQVVVIGSGNIGIEVAQAMRHRGCRVSVVEMMNRILPRLFDDIPASLIEERLRDAGIEIYTGEEVKLVWGTDRVEGVLIGSGQISCDTVVWALGVQPNVEMARQAGIALGNLGGINVDSFMQTNLEDVYAAGDCIESLSLITGRPVISPLWPNAKRQGQIAALNCLGKKTEYEGSMSLVSEDIGGLRAVSMGLTRADVLNESVEILEGQRRGCYWQVLLADDLFVGMQTVGIDEGLGALLALLKKRCTRRQLLEILNDTEELRNFPWYLPTRQFFD